MYPSRSNFEAWAQLGNKGWGPDEMAPYLRKFHTFTPPIRKTAELLATDEYLKADHQGADGPVPVTLPDVYSEFNRAWNEAFRGLGWDTTADPIGGEKLGAFACPLSVDGKGRRGYAMAYYTAEVAQRSNLTLRTETLVEKVRFDQAQERPRATGVQVRIENGGSECITARREVILCAGCINSPQLLELSGVGRAETLRQHGIPVILDCPGVGENLQDHAMVTLCFEVADGQVSGDALRDPNVLQPLIKQYEAAGSGPMAGAPASMAYLPLIDDRGQLSREAVQQLLAGHDEEGSPKEQPQYDLMKQKLLENRNPNGQYMFAAQQHHMKSDATTAQDFLAKIFPKDYVSISVLLNRPFSRGTVHIRSSHIEDKPVYDPKMLSHPLDLELLARQTQYVDRIVRMEPLASLLKPDSRIPQHATDLSDLDVTKEIVKERLFTCFHPTGTCAMLPADIGGVVDSRLTVHGTRNLRVVDASVFPLEPAGNIQATVYAVAERAADLIKEENH